MCVCVRAYNCFWLDCEGEAWHIHFPHGTHFWQHIKYIQHEFMYVWVSKEGRKRRAMVVWIEWALLQILSLNLENVIPFGQTWFFTLTLVRICMVGVLCVCMCFYFCFSCFILAFCMWVHSLMLLLLFKTPWIGRSPMTIEPFDAAAAAFALVLLVKWTEVFSQMPFTYQIKFVIFTRLNQIIMKL